jgi:cytochrome b561
MSQFVIARPERYTAPAIVLHWLIAGLIVLNIGVGLTAESFPETWVRPMIDLHKSVGLTVLGLVVLRSLWRLTHPAPALPARYSRAERIGSHSVHILLYGLMAWLPISGWLHDSAFKDAAAHPLRLFWTIPWFRIQTIANMEPVAKEALHARLYTLHAWGAYALYAFVAVHIIGALKHQFVDSDAELQRMWLWSSTNRDP